MENQLAQFQGASPDELREALSKSAADDQARFAAVRVFGPEIITRHFELPKMPAPETVSGTPTKLPNR